MAETLNEIQFAGQILMCAKADVATIRTDVENDRSLEITSAVFDYTPEQVPNEPSFGAPFAGVVNGAMSRTVTLTVNERLYVGSSAYWLLHDAIENNTPVVLYAKFGPGAISTTNREAQCEFIPNTLKLGGTPGQKRANSYTFPIIGGTYLLNSIPPAP